jgi:branched-chain amino acid transport system substrate-binding protein
MYIFQVRTPEQSKGRWDDYEIIAAVPGDEAFRPLDQGGCKLVQH